MKDRILVAFALIAVWQLLSVLSGSYWVPSPATTVIRFGIDLGSRGLPGHAWHTILAIVGGFIAGAVPAVLCPLLLRRRPVVVAVLDPFIAAGYGIPKLAITPLFVLWFGIGVTSKIALVAVSVFFILYVNTTSGVRGVDPRLMRMARIAGASEGELLRRIVLPAVLPYLTAGVRLALPYSVGAAVVAELLSANRGLGYLVQRSAMSFDTAGVFVGLVAVGILLFAASWILNQVECRLVPWRTMPVREAA